MMKLLTNWLILCLAWRRHDMVNFYVYKVVNGTKKWTDVPKLWNKKVQQQLIEEGYILNDDGTVTEDNKVSE